MISLWLNKRNWRHVGPIVNMGVHNAHSFSTLGMESHFVVGAGDPSDTDNDLRSFYGLDPSPCLHIHRRSRANHPSLTSASLPVFLHAFRCARRLALKDRVAVFTRDTGFLPFLMLLCRHPRIRGFYEAHDLYADYSWRQGKVSLRRHRDKWMERLFLPFISGIVCITHEQEKLYRQIFPRVPTVACSLGTKPFPGSDCESRRLARTLFYVGHINNNKGIPFLLKSTTALARNGIRTEFWGGYERDALRIRKHAENEGISSMVRAEAFRPPVELHQALAARGSLGVVLLSDTFYNRNLTCPVKALDYLSHGIPAFGTPLPSVKEVLGSSGHYLEGEDVDRFVSRATELLDDPVAYAAACAASRSRAAELSWTERARRLAAFAGALFPLSQSDTA